MRIRKEHCAAIIIDIQERLFPHMHQKEELLRKCTILIGGLKVLGVPLLITEQYPRGLGSTLEEIYQRAEQVPVLEKIAFSCCDEPSVMKHAAVLNHSTFIICGIEAHVCVLQTVIDLQEAGYKAVVVEDCISSRNSEDKRLAVERMRAEGAVISSCESILFELARVAGTEEFKAISRLVK